MKRVVVIGGGWAGCSAAMAAAKAGARVTLLERTDLLLGTGLVGGIMRNNGRFAATEEMIAMGAGELFEACDRLAVHANLDFPDHNHASLYNVSLIETEVRNVLKAAGVDMQFKARVTGVEMVGTRIQSVTLKGTGTVAGDVFVDATGSAGPMNNCTKFGDGCMMCVLRCPAFGGRVSVAGLCGVQEQQSEQADGKIGAYSGSCKLAKESLAPWVVEELNAKGKILLPLPAELQDKSKLGVKACQQYAGGAFAENAVILDTGHAKLMTPYMHLDKLRSIPGLESARYVDPYAGGTGNSVRFLSMAPHDTALKVDGVDNLWCGGEKAGPLVGHTEAMVSGTLAGYNAAVTALGGEAIVYPESLAVGDAIAHVTALRHVPGGWATKITFSGASYFERMKQLGLYTTDVEVIRERVRAAGAEGIFASRAENKLVV